MEDIFSLFSKGKFDELVGEYLGFVHEVKPSRDPQKRQENAKKVYFVLAACEQCGYYCDYLDVLKKLNELAPLRNPGWNKRDLAVMVDFALESLLYCLLNNSSEDVENKNNISEQIEKVINFQDAIIQEPGSTYFPKRKEELRVLYNDYKNKKMPIYVVEYLYPYEPIIKDYTFDLSSCYPYISLEVKKVSRDIDSYTNFKFKAYGLIKPDTFWRGPRYKTSTKMYPIKDSLKIANIMLLQAIKASPGKLVVPYSIEQVSTASMFQYRWDEKEPILNGTITGTAFSAHWVGNNAQWHQFTDEEMQELNKQIANTYNSKPFVTTYHNAVNLLSAGFYLEAFTLSCSCMEGMVYHWFQEISRYNGTFEKYMKYSTSKISPCDVCGFLPDSAKKKPYNGMEPTLFAHVNFMLQNNCITKDEKKNLLRLISKIRNDKLRNKTVHGENSEASKKIAEESLQGIMELQNVFIEIADRNGTKENELR